MDPLIFMLNRGRELRQWMECVTWTHSPFIGEKNKRLQTIEMRHTVSVSPLFLEHRKDNALSAFYVRFFFKYHILCAVLSVRWLCCVYRGGAEEAARGDQCGDAEAGAGKGTLQKAGLGAKDERCPEIQVSAELMCVQVYVQDAQQAHN